MKEYKSVGKGTVIRTIVLLIAIANQVVACLGATSFASAPWYQVLSVVVTAVTALWTAWQNNDWTYFARIGTGVLDALRDGKITVEEVKKILDNENHQENK